MGVYVSVYVRDSCECICETAVVVVTVLCKLSFIYETAGVS